MLKETKAQWMVKKFIIAKKNMFWIDTFWIFKKGIYIEF